MTKITARGKKYGKPLTVEWEDDEVLFDDEENQDLQEELEGLLEKPRPMGGTYYPPKDSPLNVVNTLQNYFFDAPAEVTVKGDIEEIPYEEGVIY